MNNNKLWFLKAQDYWNDVSPDVDGMLGGYPELDDVDLLFSEIFLKKYFESGSGELALDAGAGIGRISKKLLSRYFKSIILLESNPVFIQKAVNDLGPICIHSLCTRLQDVEFDGLWSYSLDLVWIQWVLIYLDDGIIILI